MRTRSRRKGKKSGRAVKLAAILLALAAIVFVVLSVLLSKRPYAEIAVSEYFNKSFTGYNGKGSLEVTLDRELLQSRLDEAFEKYEGTLFKSGELSVRDYYRFIDTIEPVLPPESSLSNGEGVLVRYNYDRALAGELNIRITGTEEELSAFGLEEARRITVEELFSELEVSFTGQSPNVQLAIKNHSEDDFIRDIVFNPVEYREYYEQGDEVAIRAYFSEKECRNRKIVVEKPSEECVRIYRVEGVDEYVKAASELPSEVIKEAISAGKTAFVDANTYGVRVFIEAGLVPIYINKQATFSWLTPSPVKAYFKTVKEGAEGKNGNHYNDLDIIYSCDMTQADGVTTSVRAVVRFSDFVKRSDGSLVYDFSHPTIISASHIAGNITKVVVDSFENDYFIEEVPIN
ncbi:MAG: hypothetical protein IJT16_12485 [Lachnospiraceae bacterium]|nr:hypothetical protein [Lachnospiraceae bacterium]